MRAFIALLLVAAANAAAPILKVKEPIPGRYIVKLKDGIDVQSVTSTVNVAGGRVGRVFNILNGFAAELSDKVLDLVSKLPGVELIEEDGVVRASAVGSWGLDRIDQANLPLDNSYTAPRHSGWQTPTVYVIDTGVLDTHNDFGGRATQAVSFVTDRQGNVDCNGHGTHCAGTVGSTTYGVAPSVKIVGVKVLSCVGSGSNSGVIAGVEWVQNNANKPAVASMSLGGGASTLLDNAVNSLVASGVPTAVAAGNDNRDACNYSPARASSAVTVGSTTSSDIRSSFSNYGSCLDIFAPGSSITSTWIGSNSATNTISGTSMACPHVAGALAVASGDRAATVLSMATLNKISFTGSGSPNKLLYVE